MVKKNRPSF